MKKTILTSILFLIIGINGNTQSLKSTEEKADSIFSELYKINTPGIAASLIKNGEVIYLKGFGSANLETETLITPQTKFQLGELSKQFTTLAILILIDQGKISLSDDIRKYIEELPKYEETITISHLLNHSSGLHDINRINTILNGNESILNQSEAMELIKAQKKLEFKPGSKFSFHEAVTESILMAEIVARSSGISFSEFIGKNIFESLGMKNSLIRDDSQSIIDDLAVPYKKEEGMGYKWNPAKSSVLGAINAYCSAEDLSIWYLNFIKPNGRLGRMVQDLDTPVQLNDGTQFDYYWGKMTIGREFSHPERGIPLYWNFGIEGGYGCNIFRFMDQKIISFVIGNNDQYNGGLAMNLIDPYVNDLYTQPEVIDYSKLKTVEMSNSEMKAFEGHYWFSPGGYATRIFVENDTLRNQWLFGTRYNTLIPISENTFQQVGTTDEIRKYKFVKEGSSTTLHFKYDESEEDIMESYVPVEPSIETLQSYSGTYYNNDYTSLILFTVSDGKLLAKNLGHKEIEYRPVKKDVFTSATYFMPALEFIRDQSDNVIGLKIDGDGVHSLMFEKAK